MKKSGGQAILRMLYWSARILRPNYPSLFLGFLKRCLSPKPLFPVPGAFVYFRWPSTCPDLPLNLLPFVAIVDPALPR